MKMLLMVIGGLIIAFGLVDLIGSFSGFDLWGEIGIHLPDLVWKYSSYIELLIGYFIFQAGRSSGAVEAVEDEKDEA